jgi:hypothetical protein
MHPFNRYTRSILRAAEPEASAAGGGNSPPPGFTQADIDKAVQAAVREAVQKAAQQERDKLYADLETAKKKAREQEDELKKLRDAQVPVERIEALQKELDTQKSAASDAYKKLDEAVELAVKRANELNEAQRKRDRVEMRKAALIDAAAGKIIAEMVTGETEEAVAASAEAARKRYEDIYAAAKKEAEDKYAAA